MGGNMNDEERRRSERKYSLNLLDNIVLGDTGETIAHEMGRTVNISENGLLLETHLPFQLQQVLIITVALDENLVEIKGRVKFVEPCGEMFRSGIEFLEIDDKGRQTLNKYLDSLSEN
jgi:c-di-GMP-binding flagellar brake protein YcgR